MNDDAINLMTALPGSPANRLLQGPEDVILSHNKKPHDFRIVRLFCV
jgi:hypothetical protein